MVVVIVKVELACGCWRFAARFLIASRVSLYRQDVRSTPTGFSECEPSDMLVMLLCDRRQDVWACWAEGQQRELVDPVSGHRQPTRRER